MNTTISKIIIISLFFIVSYKSSANDSNLDDFMYPSHDCDKKTIKPKKPTKPSTYQSIEKYDSAVANYNIDVIKYNKDIKKYKLCINQYIKNGNHDMNHIRKKLNSALKDARR